MSTRKSGLIKDTARFVRPSSLPGVELVSASYRNRAFPTHTHPEYVIGAIVQGAESLRVGGASYVAPEGATLVLHPDEAHSNSSIGEQTLAYRVFYIAAESLALGLEKSGMPSHLPAFARPVISSPSLFRKVVTAHRALSEAGDTLEQETSFLELLSAVLSASTQSIEKPAVECPENIATAKAFVEEYFREGFTLGAVARASGLSSFHMARSFKRATGLTPLNFRNQLRVWEARRQLQSGRAISEIALDVGFADQSHLTRQFQRVFGTTPARYAQQ